MSIVLPNLTDKEFSSYNDVNRMRRIIDDFFNKVILTKKATYRLHVTSGELKHLIERWAGLKMNHKQERVYGYNNTYILEPFLVKVMHEKGIALKESNLSQSNILYSRCFVGIPKKSIEKLQCFIHQATPDDDFKVKPFYWHLFIIRRSYVANITEKDYMKLAIDDVWKAHDWKKIYYGKHV